MPNIALRPMHILCGFLAISAQMIPSPLLAADFPSVVAEVMNGQKDGPLTRMSAGKKQAMIQCVIGALAGVPAGKKRYVQEGATYDEREDRFGEVVMANRAEWKQKITKACANLAVSGGA
jgi:hypothetical protein